MVLGRAPTAARGGASALLRVRARRGAGVGRGARRDRGRGGPVVLSNIQALLSNKSGSSEDKADRVDKQQIQTDGDG